LLSLLVTEDFTALQPGSSERLPHFLFVAIHLRGVDVPIADTGASLTAAAVSAGAILKTPKPSCGIACPLLRARLGAVT
jgi:hypothetical protein